MPMITQPIFQYAFVVNNIAEAALKWAALTGAGPFFVVRHHRADIFDYRGTDVQADVSYAFGYSGDVQIQFIELHDDLPSIYTEMFKPGEEGFHHVAMLGVDFPAQKQQLVDQGLPVAMTLWADADVAYFDARAQIGYFIELHGTSPAVYAIFAGWKAAHATWDGKTDLIREVAID